MSRSYANTLMAALSPAERKIFAKLSTAEKIQDYLDRLPINFEMQGETYMSPRRLLRERTAHCFEGALLAAAAFAYHGHRPLLLDLQTRPEEEDHVVALFREHGLWGAISKTNHGILRYRDPIYRSVRELAMSYAHEYIMDDGRKSLRAFSSPFDLSRFAPERWVTAEEDLEWLVETLDSSRHFPIAPKKVIRRLRRASKTEIRTLDIEEWKTPHAFRRYA
ncbi:hypothetical protein A3C18_03385 [Candidatus Kaiserbacteria bacterium RIFCSPHIGHO2_02_FULL_54_11b]|uniref:Transglutaminase-like domain-containing protein n=2 Tax=Candidatus Kaiseribacteriota TaxID=1752734 RepID=A0A1F6CJN2_9BACT|nr:MAG: hypothetical protein A2704_04230 [Candidatus Kaiserbacteria bacterium RIFCSPHIGHO2_01_FULL_54_36b]OGG64611.1 MAG: hypothetical protein A3C18_03385 [Candidatus Kaiserbacteria bacterium RIFCSPHIGHO2_02_FULL_54_11b]